MVIFYRLTKIILFFSILLVSFSCKDECLDVELINQNTLLLEAWFTDSAIDSKQVISSIGIADEVIVKHDFQDYGDSIWDDCGNVTQSYRNIVSYEFFNFPYYIETELNKQGEEDGFEFRISINFEQISWYRFYSQQTSSNSIELLENLEINAQVFSEVLKVNFNQNQSENGIKTIFFVKNHGIIRIELYNGTSLVLE